MCDAFGQVWAEMTAMGCDVISVRLSYYTGFRWSVEVSPEDFVRIIDADEEVDAIPIGGQTLYVVEHGAFDLTCKIASRKKVVSAADIELPDRAIPFVEFRSFER